MAFLQSSVPASRVELFISCENLADTDVFSKSDPICVVSLKNPVNQKFSEIARTERIENCQNPKFTRSVELDYFFEERQELRFSVFDVDNETTTLDDDDYLGKCEAFLGEIASSIKRTYKLTTKHSGQGTLTVRCEEMSANKNEAFLHLRCRKLDNKDTFGKSDPFLRLSRANEDGSFTAVHQTEVVDNNLNPTFKPFTISLNTLCNGDRHRTIRVEVFDHDSDGSHDLIGRFETSLQRLEQGAGAQNVYDVINEKKAAKKGKKYHNSGTCELLRYELRPIYSFLDFIAGGMQIHCTVAIDFTASNVDPRQANSLHFINSAQPNQYQVALQSVLEIIQDYDTDKQFPVLGFGAKMPDGSVHHDFALNFQPNNPFCFGIGGVLSAYTNAIQSVTLWGPTNFSPVIRHVAQQARTFGSAGQRGRNYFILLILTDGVISDMEETVASIIDASTLPMSIIIVGVGGADFGAMDALDSDQGHLRRGSAVAQRDIVQFVAFRDFQRGGGVFAQKASLAKKVLAEVPKQVVDYMRFNGIAPLKPPMYQQQQQLPPEASAPPAPPSLPPGF